MRVQEKSTIELKKPPRARKKRRCSLPLFRTDSCFVFIWNIISVLFFLYYITLMPFFIAFDLTFHSVLILEQVMDAFFILDLFVNFNIMIRRGDRLITSRREIAKNYLKTFFVLDVITSIPFSFILDFSQNSFSGINKLLRLYKLPKLFAAIIKTNFFNLINFLKIFKFKEFYRYQIRAKAPLFRTIYVTVVTFLVMHIGACLFIFLGKNDYLRHGTWLDYLGAAEQSHMEVYTTAIYYCFVVLTTVGYGDVVSRSNFEIVFTLVWMIGGIAFYSFTISMITLFFTAKHNRKTLLEKKVISFEKYVNEHKLPSQLREEIKKFLEYVSHKISYRWDERRRNVIENLPLELKYHFFTEVHREIMLECPFFRTRDINFKVKMMSLMKPVLVKKGNYIWRKNDRSNCIIFIEKGNVDLTINNVFLDVPASRRRSISHMNTPSKMASLGLFGNLKSNTHFSFNESKHGSPNLNPNANSNANAKVAKSPQTPDPEPVQPAPSTWAKWARRLLCWCRGKRSQVLPRLVPPKSTSLPQININLVNNISKQETQSVKTNNKSKFDKYFSKKSKVGKSSFHSNNDETKGGVTRRSTTPKRDWLRRSGPFAGPGHVFIQGPLVQAAQHDHAARKRHLRRESDAQERVEFRREGVFELAVGRHRPEHFPAQVTNALPQADAELEELQFEQASTETVTDPERPVPEQQASVPHFREPGVAREETAAEAQQAGFGRKRHARLLHLRVQSDGRLSAGFCTQIDAKIQETLAGRLSA